MRSTETNARNATVPKSSPHLAGARHGITEQWGEEGFLNNEIKTIEYIEKRKCGTYLK